ncbi:c-type cytochrome biogenesis protein CcsB [Dissulfurirhabdus thermomarina]|uniref:Heme exporter protein C n=1 Tax=Dissulfurirhabdus thermomarina TaxID=1765737 RepID=A0A6N9TNZ3_DISTH|nr:c-type cytochrome biogenesis protein CcsB [Dissulfurirhabdus thermomarina]NDY43002.1 c-type cytochrome biogenesis protein CcsB [Dissulfurirhabdus thermomarina]NMX23652.1 c-type cytochrome biogenesis protein CcsB [Dissulfurirhabdus thermomarina]
MNLDSSFFLSLTTFVYLGAAVIYLFHWIFRVRQVGVVASLAALGGLLLQTAGIGLRWVESYQRGYGHAPLSNLYESLVFFAWVVILVYLVVERRTKNRVIGAFATPFAALAMAYASFSPQVEDAIQPLVPALKSNWLIAHVVTCFLGYAAFAVACGLGIMYLIRYFSDENPAGLVGTLPPLRTLDALMYQTLTFGFVWLSLGIITGAVWANEAWGSYWTWDPKETWSLITWFVYAVALHARFVRGWTGPRIAVLAIVGFAAVIFTYFGVNFLLSGLHSYGAQ